MKTFLQFYESIKSQTYLNKQFMSNERQENLLKSLENNDEWTMARLKKNGFSFQDVEDLKKELKSQLEYSRKQMKDSWNNYNASKIVR